MRVGTSLAQRIVEIVKEKELVDDDVEYWWPRRLIRAR